MADTLEQAVTNAVEKTPAPDGTSDKDTEKITKADKSQNETSTDEQTDETEESEEEVASESDELSEDETRQARDLFKALRDPNKSGIIIDALARQAGYDKAPQTKKEVTEQTDDILDLLKESLGPGLEFLAEKLAPALRKTISKELTASREENARAVNERLNAIEKNRLQDEGLKTLDKLAKEYFNADEMPKNVMSKMNQLLDEMPPTQGMSMDKYLKRTLHTAMGELGITKSNKTTSDKKQSPISRLASERSGGDKGLVNNGTTKMNLNDAIKLALEAVDAK